MLGGADQEIQKEGGQGLLCTNHKDTIYLFIKKRINLCTECKALEDTR